MSSAINLMSIIFYLTQPGKSLADFPTFLPRREQIKIVLCTDGDTHNNITDLSSIWTKIDKETKRKILCFTLGFTS